MQILQSTLVTGAAGFIGSHLCEALLRQGEKVVGIDSFDPFYDRSIKLRNLQDLANAAPSGQFTFHEADIRDADALTRAFSAHRPRSVVHLAALAGVRPSVSDAARYMDVNVVGTTRLLDAAIRHSVDRAVVASSSSVYGADAPLPFTEDAAASLPMSPYAASKRATEHVAHAMHHVSGMPITCLRFFTVYGPRQRPDLAISRFMRALASEETITLFGDGSSSRDYTYIDDIIAGALAALGRTDEAGFRVWNLGGDHRVRLDELVSAIAETVGRKPRIVRKSPFVGDMTHTAADLTRARAELGYAPATTLADGLRRQWDWMRSV